MRMRRISTYTIDLVAVVAAVVLATPFLAILVAPFVTGF